jgi:hypothetical protein
MPTDAETLKANPVQLNPWFVEWLMGWPLGWTGFERAGMVLSRYRQRLLSLFSITV